MKKAIVIFLGVLLLGYVLAIFLPVNPDEARAGTRLSGEIADREDFDWPFFRNVELVTVQTSTRYFIPHSVTVTSWAADGNYYLGCGGCAAKIWPKNIAYNPEVVVKVNNKLFEGQAFLTTGSERQTALSVPLGNDIPNGDEAFRVELR